MKRKSTIPTILGVIILIAGSIAGVLLLKNTQRFSLGAEVGAEVKNIRATNISDNSVTISWTTDIETESFLTWGASQSSLDRIEKEDSARNKYHNHSITVTGLNPSTKYYYKINSNGELFDNSGIPWSVTTGPTLASINNSYLISGNIVDATGSPIKRALVYADIGGYLLSTVTSETGNYVFQMGGARTIDLTGYAQIDPVQTVITISVQAIPQGVADAQILLQAANPVSPITIGQSYDFRTNTANNLGVNPDADLSLPTDLSTVSKFNVEPLNPNSKPTTVILESIVEGEIITTTKPQFFGKAPEGTNLTITVHSNETISGNVIVPSSGSWNFSVPTNLSPGTHSITISWIDLSGITRFLTRDFVVQAAEVPLGFTASNSAQTPTPSPTPIPNVTNTPTVSPSFTATPTPIVVPSNTPTPSPAFSPTLMPVPVTGDLTPSFLLFIMGLTVLTFSFVVWKLSEN